MSRISDVCVGWLLEDFEQAVGGFFHERRRGEDGKRASGFDRRTVVGDVNDLADLAELDEQLRRIGRHDEDVGMGLDEDAGLLFVGFAEVVAGVDGLGDQLVEIGGVGDAGAVAADAAEVGEAVGLGRLEAVDGLGEHEGEGVFACAAGAGQDEGVRETLGADGFAEMRDRGGVAEEVLEAHGMRIVHLGELILRLQGRELGHWARSGRG